MSQKKPAEHFADIRGRLAKVWPKQKVDLWFKTEHQALGMRSPAHAIHAGNHAGVHVLVDAVENGRG